MQVNPPTEMSSEVTKLIREEMPSWPCALRFKKWTHRHEKWILMSISMLFGLSMTLLFFTASTQKLIQWIQMPQHQAYSIRGIAKIFLFSFTLFFGLVTLVSTSISVYRIQKSYITS